MIQTLKVHSREHYMIPVPWWTRDENRPVYYIGRKYKAPKKGEKKTVLEMYPSIVDEYEVVLALSDKEDRETARRIKKFVKEGALFAADEETARYCGVELEALEFSNGRWTIATIN